jgi:hypothetical protein
MSKAIHITVKEEKSSKQKKTLEKRLMFKYTFPMVMTDSFYFHECFDFNVILKEILKDKYDLKNFSEEKLKNGTP